MAEMKARYKPGQEIPGFAGTAVVGGRFVKLTGAKTASGDYPIAHAALGQRALGVAEYDSAAATGAATDQDRRVNIVRAGAIARVTSGAAVSIHDRITSDANGKAIATTTAGHYIHGVALTAATDADQVIEVELVPSFFTIPA